ncbi:Uncharacterised protein [Moraxella caviae]|uniref:Uncharacterized protein n=1 Tax=Moraxella caviae TaxID=34060 RepID=A0A378R553_9GAMM|nr:hypothetical protein [Moraxella caviae]STZ09889.1 Uncharacterised protein [Moraxella caviae]
MTKFIIGIIIGLLLSFGFDKVSTHLKADECLDAGGSFDYQSETCDYGDGAQGNKNHGN